MPYKIVKADNGDAWVEVRGNKLAPPQVSAEVLRKMKKTAEDPSRRADHRGRDHGARLLQRQPAPGDQDAGKIAGLDVKRIINEPTGGAARLRPGQVAEGRPQDRRSMTSAAAPSTSRSSRSPTSTARSSSRCSTNGDTFLGGEDFDQRVIDLSSPSSKGEGVDLSRTCSRPAAPEGSGRKAKIELSSSAQTDINLPYITADLGAQAPEHQAHARQARGAGRRPDRAHHRAVPHRDQGCRACRSPTSRT